jgi:hypothetical protein
MEKVVNKIRLSAEIEKNLEFWALKSDEEKISAVQELREQYIKLYNKEKEYNESRKRLRRFYRVIKQTQS